MHPQTPEEWPIIRNVIGPLADWWRRHAIVRQNRADLEAFHAEDLVRMAQDVGLTSSDLSALASHYGDAADLLERRLEACGLRAKELAQTAPAELRDMERLCTVCRSKRRCARDLGADPADPVWRQYCPNEQTLMELARAGTER
jgi:hypothetical protein